MPTTTSRFLDGTAVDAVNTANPGKKGSRSKFDISHFDANAVLRGMQLTLVGAHRALQNPSLFTNEHYKQALYAVIAGIAIRVVVSIPIMLVKAALWMLSFFISLESVTWDDSVVASLDFIAEYVLQIPFFLMTLMRYISPTLDNLFMQSIYWVDKTYSQKHKDDPRSQLRRLHYPGLEKYGQLRRHSDNDKSGWRWKSLYSFFYRFGRKGLISLMVFLLSQLPLVGHVVLPFASFYTFKKAVGIGPASLIFGVGLLLPRMYIVVFLQTYFSSRSLMRELLVPYFSRAPFTSEQKKKWFRSREGVLFGFGLGFYMLVRVPLVGVLIYGIAEASTAFLITKITDPLPTHAKFKGYADDQLDWKNKHEFLSASMWRLDEASLIPSTDGNKEH